MPEGAIYAFDQSIDTKKPYFKTPIKGLYLASASTFPGSGIEARVISGMTCANDICNWEVKRWTSSLFLKSSDLTGRITAGVVHAKALGEY